MEIAWEPCKLRSMQNELEKDCILYFAWEPCKLRSMQNPFKLYCRCKNAWEPCKLRSMQNDADVLPSLWMLENLVS